ncbi:hypothetical protein [Deinococcus misasensis]|uniref:hypothetical protein n=1 Tax=Deinococcus misasensis TaxID=392413 RepID=UPI00055863BE|nr:hypothetical protein [Deinococcus misasensis]
MPAALMWVLTIIGTLFFSGGVPGIQKLLTPQQVGVYRDVPEGTAGSSPDDKPSFSEVVKDTVNTPSSVWGIAAIGFVGVFLIAQLRAGAHEAGTAAVATYNEAKATTRKLSKPNTKNQSRFATGEGD